MGSNIEKQHAFEKLEMFLKPHPRNGKPTGPQGTLRLNALSLNDRWRSSTSSTPTPTLAS
eukprot:2423495-Amphidinium_carterae.2